MASNVTRDHHNLRRNLKLNDYRISNDGGDEGININDTGIVQITRTGGDAILTLNSLESNGDSSIRFYDGGSSPGTAADAMISFANNATAVSRALQFQIADTGDKQFHFGGNGKMMIGNAIGANPAPQAYLDIEAATTQSNVNYPTSVAPQLRLSYNLTNYAEFATAIDGALTVTTVGANNAVVTVDDLTPSPVGGAWEASQTHYNISQTSTDGSGSGLVCNIETDGSGNPEFTINHAGTGYAVDEEITFTDPHENTSNTAILIVATLSSTEADIVLSPDGNVGIGVSDPDTLLEIFGTSTQLKLSYNADDYATFTVADTGDLTITTVGDGTRDSDLALIADGDLILNCANTNDIIFKNGSNERLTIDTTGNLIYPGGMSIEAETSIELDSGSGDIYFTKDGVFGDLFAQWDMDNNFYQQHYDSNNYFRLFSEANGATTLSTVDSDGEVGHLTLVPDGDTIIDRNTALTATATAKGLHIDYDHTGISASGQTITGIGLDLDMNCESVTHVGTVNQTGIDLDMVAATDGTQGNIGIDIACSGSDTCTGLTIDATAGTTSNGIYLDNKNGGTDFKNVSSADNTDYFLINTIAAGATTLRTVDTSVGATAHLTLDVDGHVEFDGCAAGFAEIAATFGDSAVILGGGPNTDIDFRLGNKYTVELGANLDSGSSEYLNLIFPATSGNFLLVLGQDDTGSRTISSGSWRAYDSGANLCGNTLFADGTDGAIRWAGGSAPTLTTTADKADIISIYWDAGSETAFAVVSQDF